MLQMRTRSGGEVFLWWTKLNEDFFPKNNALPISLFKKNQNTRMPHSLIETVFVTDFLLLVNGFHLQGTAQLCKKEKEIFAPQTDFQRKH